MITIYSGMTNSIVLRLYDKETITNPIYMFKFECVQSGDITWCSPADQSTTNRYNLFKIYEVGGNSTFTASTPKIELPYGGYYNYTIYERSDYSMTASSVILDEGKMLFVNGEYENFFFFRVN